MKKNEGMPAKKTRHKTSPMENERRRNKVVRISGERQGRRVSTHSYQANPASTGALHASMISDQAGQPWSRPTTSGSTSRNRPAVTAAAPPRSSRSASGEVDSPTYLMPAA